MSEANKAFVRRYLEECINKRDAEAADQFIATDYLDHDSPPGAAPGLAGFKQVITKAFNAFPDFHYIIEDLIAEGDRVVSRGTVHGTHLGEFRGIAPTGNQITIKEVHIVRISGGKMVEHWEVADGLGLMRQLGVIPGP